MHQGTTVRTPPRHLQEIRNRCRRFSTDGPIPGVQRFNRSANRLRNFATLGAITTWQYGW